MSANQGVCNLSTITKSIINLIGEFFSISIYIYVSAQWIDKALIYVWPKNQLITLVARIMGPTSGPSGANRTQVDPMLAPWNLLSEV